MANGQLWEIDSQGNKKIISGLVTGELPKYTMAEYTALTNKPQYWICTDYDATSEYGINATEVKYDNSHSVKDKVDNLSAEDIAYDSNNSVKDMINTKFATVTGNFASTVGSFSTINYPTGFSQANSYVIGFEIEANGYWRTGQGIYSASSRIFCYLGGTNIQCYNDDSNLVSANVRVTLMKYLQ